MTVLIILQRYYLNQEVAGVLDVQGQPALRADQVYERASVP